MRKSLLALFILLVLFSCSNKDPESDWTTNFIGKWKTDIQVTSRDSIWSTYDIKRINNNMVKINVVESIISINWDFDSYTVKSELDSVRVTGSNSMIYEYIISSGEEVYLYDVKGTVDKAILSLDVNVSLKNAGASNSFTRRLYKQ